MRMLRLTLICLLFSSFCHFAVAQTSHDHEKLSLELRAQAILAEVQIENKILNSEMKVASLPEGAQAEELKSLLAQAAAEAKDPSTPQKAKHALAKALASIPVGLYQDVRDVGRKYGSGVVIVFTVVSLLDTFSPFFFLAVGNPGLAAFVEVFPSGPIFTGVYVAADSFRSHRHLVSQYGGEESFHKIKNARKTSKALLQLKKESDILFQLSDSSIFSISSSDFFGRLLMHLHLKKHRATFNDWVKASKRAGVEVAVLKRIHAMNGLNDSDRTAVLIEYLQQNDHQEVIQKMESRFAKEKINPSTLTVLPSLGQGMSQWVEAIAEVKSCDAFTKWIETIPENTPTRTVAAIWNRLAFPELIKNYPGFKIKLFRKIAKNTQLLFIDAEQSTALWTPAQTHAMQSVVKKYCL